LLAALRSFSNIEVEARIYDFALNLSLVSRTKPKGFLKD
jgi:hypothetical protein